MKIKFCGAARNVTGSKHLITTDAGSKILLDCGLFQGRRAESREKNKNFQFVPSKLDAVIIGHAHIDHSGNLPNLSKSGYTKLVHATAPTDALVHYMLPDSAYIQERDAEFFNKKQKRCLDIWDFLFIFFRPIWDICTVLLGRWILVQCVCCSKKSNILGTFC